MTEFIPEYGNPRRHVVVARLPLRPSDAIKEMIEPLYRPSVAEKKLSDIALKSCIGVPLEVLPRGRFIYENPHYPDMNSIQEFQWFEENHVRPIVGHQLPLLSDVKVLRNKAGTVRLQMPFALNHDEQSHLSQLEPFEGLAHRHMIETYIDVGANDIVPNETVLQSAVKALRSSLGVDHPARRGQLPHKRSVSEQHYAEPTGKNLTF